MDQDTKSPQLGRSTFSLDNTTEHPRLEPDGYISNQEDTDFEFYGYCEW